MRNLMIAAAPQAQAAAAALAQLERALDLLGIAVPERM